MRAILWTAYGSPQVLQPGEVEKPSPRRNEVLVRVHASTVTTGDCEMRRLKLPLFFSLPMRIYVGLRRPKRITILGQELAGDVEAVGSDVRRFKPGDAVFGTTSFHLGAYAEYICLPDNFLAPKPSNLTYEQAAAVPLGGLESLYYLSRSDLRSEQKVLIYGAGGSIGTAAVQLARSYGAEVTAVDRGSKLDMLRSIGAAHVIDYTREDFTQGGVMYDVIFDVVGKSPFPRSFDSIKVDGRYLVANPSLSHLIRGPRLSKKSHKKILAGKSEQKVQDLIQLKDLIEAAKITPVIDRIYPLEQTAEAHSYVDTGEKKGAVVITLEHLL
jgi:NADPH:quinone reductase-like Zn-dependent oxidoreductase